MNIREFLTLNGIVNPENGAVIEWNKKQDVSGKQIVITPEMLSDDANTLDLSKPNGCEFDFSINKPFDERHEDTIREFNRKIEETPSFDEWVKTDEYKDLKRRQNEILSNI